MAEQTEEITHAQAEAVADRLLNEYRFVGQLHGVLKRYNEAKAELPEAEKRLAALRADIKTAESQVANIKDFYERTLREAEADIRRQKESFAKDHATKAERLNSIIKGLEDQRAQKDAELKDVTFKADNKIKALQTEIRDAQARAKVRIEAIEKQIAEREAEYVRAKERIESLRSELGSVRA